MAAIPSILSLPSPSRSGIDLWLVDLDTAPGLWDAGTLSVKEEERARRFRFEVHAHRYRASHAALRRILGEATGRDPASLVFTEGVHGKPRLAQAGAPHFNLSHSAGWALVGICASHPIGVDIEVVHAMDDAPALARSHFTAAEQATFFGTPAEDRAAAFFSGWTRKEACLKALGSGLSIEPHTFEAGIDTGPREVTVRAEGQPCAMHLHSLEPLPVAGLIAAVARLHDTHSPGLL